MLTGQKFTEEEELEIQETRKRIAEANKREQDASMQGLANILTAMHRPSHPLNNANYN